MNQLNRNQEMISKMTRFSKLANKAANIGLATNYMKHVDTIEKANRLMKNNIFAYSILDRVNKGVADHLINNSMHTMALIPRHDFSQMTNAISLLANQRIAFSNAYQFAPFLNHISSTFDSSFLENLSEYIYDTDGEDLEEIEELHEEDVQLEIKRPHFFDLAIKINIIINLTESEIEVGNAEEVRNWKKVILPILTVLCQLFIAWAVSDTPLHETNIYKSIESIIHYIETIDIDFDNEE